MRGLAFPTDAAFNRELSYEYGTPISTVAEDIPIDPALNDAIDPALQEEEGRDAQFVVSASQTRPGLIACGARTRRVL